MMILFVILFVTRTRQTVEVVINFIHTLVMYGHDLVHLAHEAVGEMCGFGVANNCFLQRMRRQNPHPMQRQPPHGNERGSLLHRSNSLHVT